MCGWYSVLLEVVKDVERVNLKMYEELRVEFELISDLLEKMNKEVISCDMLKYIIMFNDVMNEIIEVIFDLIVFFQCIEMMEVVNKV